MARALVLACALVLTLAGAATATPVPTCTVSNGILTLWNAPAGVKCVARSDIVPKYIDASGNIPPKFIYGATVNPHNLAVTLTFYSTAVCTDMTSSITCVNLPDTECILNGRGKPVLTNVGPPALCALRGDTDAVVHFDPGMSTITVPLGDRVDQDFCPIQVNLFKDAGCSQFLATQEIDCPCLPVCVPV